MGLLAPHAVGRSQRFYVTRETTALTYKKPVAGSAVKVLQSTFDRSQDRKDRADARLTRSQVERITGNTTTTATIEMYVVPSGTAGTPPDCHDLLLAHFGTYANSAGASDTYSPTDSQTAMGSVSLTREFNAGTVGTGIISQGIPGFTPNKWKCVLKGGDEPKFTFEGEGYDLLSTTYTTLGVTAASGATSISVVEGAAAQVIVDNANATRAQSVIQIGTQDNTSAGYDVTAVNGTVWSISPSLAGTVNSGSDVTPFVPAETVSGSPIAGILGTLSFDATNRPTLSPVPIVECTIERDNGNQYFHDEAFQSHMTDVVPGFSKTKVSFTIRARRDHVRWISEHEGAIATQYPVVLTCGLPASNTAGNGHRMVITMNRVEFQKTSLDTPAGDAVAMIKLEGEAIATSSGADEIQVAFT